MMRNISQTFTYMKDRSRIFCGFPLPYADNKISKLIQEQDTDSRDIVEIPQEDSAALGLPLLGKVLQSEN